jgi:hypothetical protein
METSFSKRTSLLATIPFGIFGIAWAVSNSGLGISGYIQSSLLGVSAIAMFVLLGIGWSKNFPRWSFPAVGFCLLFTAFLVMITIPALKREPLGYWAVLPLVTTLVVCLFFNPKLEPIKHLIQKTKEDLSLILFALYGFAPTFIWFFYDEMHSIWLVPVILLSTLILCFGLYSFLRSDKKKIRIISIIVSGLVAFVIAIVVSFLWKQ